MLHNCAIVARRIVRRLHVLSWVLLVQLVDDDAALFVHLFANLLSAPQIKRRHIHKLFLVIFNEL